MKNSTFDTNKLEQLYDYFSSNLLCLHRYNLSKNNIIKMLKLCQLYLILLIVKILFLIKYKKNQQQHLVSFSFFPFIFISWRLITLQYCSGFCHTLTWISHGFTCIPHPDPPSHPPLYLLPQGLPSAPGPSTCLMHPTWTGDLFHYR